MLHVALRESPTIINFWMVVHAFSLEQKKMFLSFVTGSGRVPIKVPILLLFPSCQTCVSLLSWGRHEENGTDVDDHHYLVLMCAGALRPASCVHYYEAWPTFSATAHSSYLLQQPAAPNIRRSWNTRAMPAGRNK